jgi:hypothetical protein
MGSLRGALTYMNNAKANNSDSLLVAKTRKYSREGRGLPTPTRSILAIFSSFPCGQKIGWGRNRCASHWRFLPSCDTAAAESPTVTSSKCLLVDPPYRRVQVLPSWQASCSVPHTRNTTAWSLATLGGLPWEQASTVMHSCFLRGGLHFNSKKDATTTGLLTVRV